MEWYPFYPVLYRADTRHLSLAEHGAYRALLDHYYETRRPLPDDDRALASIAGATPTEWRRMRDTIRALFTATGHGELLNKRCERILTSQDERANRRSEAAKHAAETRWKNNNLHAARMPNACEPHTNRNANAMRFDAIGQDRTGESDSPPLVVPPPANSGAKPAKGNGHDKQSNRGSRLPNDWEPDADDRQFAAALGLDVEREAAQFRDYWHDQPGARGRKVRWHATWRNWCRRAAERRSPGRQPEGIMAAAARIARRLDE